jgi:curved DNA-binding protein CbpA
MVAFTMDRARPIQPAMLEYYFGLELDQGATTAKIKKVYRRLALLHHSDKKSPGKSIDAHRHQR